jgi:hypothetical protein
MNLLTLFVWMFFWIFSTPDAKSKEVFNLINAYRIKNGKSALKFCDSLAYVASIHAYDQFINYRIDDRTCSMHSWSISDKWKGGCITEDKNIADWVIMWDKPQELIGMKQKGYEISYMYDPKTTAIDPKEVVEGWIKSLSHRNCMIERGWHTHFNRMGVGIYQGHVNVWFAE